MAKTSGAAASARKKTPAKSKATPKSSGRGSSTSSKSKTKTKTPHTSHSKNKSPNYVFDQGVNTYSEVTLYEDKSKQLYSSVELDPRRDMFMKSDPLSRSTFSTNSNDTWRVTIGDLACIEGPTPASMSEDEKEIYPPGPQSRVSAPPFTKPWYPCQILSMFRKRVRNNKLSTKKDWGPLQLEVRWFYRQTSLDDRNKRYEKSAHKKKYSKKVWEEIFETDHVAVIDASLLLGRLLVLKDNGQKKSGNDHLKYPVPTAVICCSRFYLHQEQDIFDVFDWDGIVGRGLECCGIMNDNLKKAAYKHLNLPTPRVFKEENNTQVTLPPGMKIDCGGRGIGEKFIAYYTSCTLSHSWPQLTNGNLFCPKTKRDLFPKWELHVGDIVAVHCEDGSKPASHADVVTGRDKWYPYRVPWSHCQVTSIFRSVKKNEEIDESTALPADSITFEIRWFPRVSEAQTECKDKKKLLASLKQISTDTERTSEVILEGNQRSEIGYGLLLGPVFIDDGSNGKPVTKFLPQNRRSVSKDIRCDQDGRPVNIINEEMFDSSLRLQRGFEVSKQFASSKASKVRFKNQVLKLRTKLFEDERAKETDDQAGDEHISQMPKDGEMESTESLTGDIAAESVECESSPHKKRQLFSGNFNNSLKSKRLRSSADDESSRFSADDNASPAKAPQDTLKSELVVDSDHSQNSEENEEHRLSCCTKPFHVDVSALKSFYEEIDIIPPVDSYDKRYSTGDGRRQSKEKWNVKIGDTVTIEVEPESKEANAVHFPFIVPWAPAEIVSIYRVHETKESCARVRNQISNGAHDNVNALQDNEDENIMIEIRWLYRPFEIPGASKKKKVSEDNGELEEVFETDQVDLCSADSILSPVRLHDIAKPVNTPTSILGMPCVNYKCNRLWSIHRRSFVPSGSLSNRVSRGRMYSAHKFALDKLSRLSSIDSTKSSDQQREQSWKETFQSAIKVLSLAEAAQDAQENGMVLACREKERAQIKGFLKIAISGLVQSSQSEEGEEETLAMKSSMLIAGPPGTGKTASVRSIIAELQQEQHEGLLPEFNFIALNGMELRHPFDSYVKFWEALSGTRKERLPAGEAANRLEHYFCGNKALDKSGDDSDDEEYKNMSMSLRPVTVLMMDEIDYIVTKKETLIYNFFDWPLRATTARLVIIGISNTINLPETLSPKVQSRIGGNRCHFQSYNVQDTITILKTRLGMLDDNPGHPVFEEDAIKFAARKTANLSGDIRKAFHMCKTAAEKVYEDYNSGKRTLPQGCTRPTVRISDVQKGSKDILTSVIHMAVKCSTTYEALLLVAIGALKRTRDDDDICFTVRDILTKIESIANASGEPRYMNAKLSFSDVLGMLNRLCNAGIVQLSSNETTPWPVVQTSLHTYEFLHCYRDTSHSKIAEKHLATERLFG